MVREGRRRQRGAAGSEITTQHTSVEKRLYIAASAACDCICALRDLTDEQRREATQVSVALRNIVAVSAGELDAYAARALLRLDALGGHSEELRQAARAVQDVVVLACAHGLRPEELRGQGMSVELKARIVNALGDASCKNLISRLGTAKYHLFNDGEKFCRRPRKSTPPHRLHQKSWEEQQAESLRLIDDLFGSEDMEVDDRTALADILRELSWGGGETEHQEAQLRAVYGLLRMPEDARGARSVLADAAWHLGSQLSRYWSWTSGGDEATRENGDRRLLRRLRWEMQRRHGRLPQPHAVTEWILEEEREDSVRPRMVLGGILFGTDFVGGLLLQELEHGRSERVITAACRAFCELSFLEGASDKLTRRVLERLMDVAPQPEGVACASARVRTLKMFHKAHWWDGQLTILQHIVDSGMEGLRKWDGGGVACESCWATAGILRHLADAGVLPRVSGDLWWRIRHLADSVLWDKNLRHEAEQEGAWHTIREAEQLRAFCDSCAWPRHP